MEPKETGEALKFLESYKEPKPVKISDIFILGILSCKNLSGYDIYKFIEKKADASGSWLKLNKSTVYNTLSRMESEGFVETIERVASNNRPTKSIYRLTPPGREHLRELLLSNSRSLPGFFVNFYLDLSFYNVLEREEMQEVIKLKIKQVDMMIKISDLYRNTLKSGTVHEVLSRSEREIYEVILRTLNNLLDLFDEKDMIEIFKIDEIDADKIFSKMGDLSREEV